MFSALFLACSPAPDTVPADVAPAPEAEPRRYYTPEQAPKAPWLWSPDTLRRVATLSSLGVGEDPVPGDAAASAEVRAILEKNLGAAQTCLERALRANPGLAGTVRVGLAIEAGRVTESHVIEDTTGDDALATCIAEASRHFLFSETLTVAVPAASWTWTPASSAPASNAPTDTTPTRVHVWPPEATLAPGDPVPGNAEASAEVRRILEKNQGSAQTCAEMAMRVDPDLTATIRVGFTIEGGRVTESHVVENTSDYDRLGTCIANATRRMRFPETLSVVVPSVTWTVSG